MSVGQRGRTGKVRGSASGGVWGKAPQLQSAPQGVNSKTVRWTVFEEGDSLQCREMSEGQRVPDTISVALQERASLNGRILSAPTLCHLRLFSKARTHTVRPCKMTKKLPHICAAAILLIKQQPYRFRALFPQPYQVRSPFRYQRPAHEACPPCSHNLSRYGRYPLSR